MRTLTYIERVVRLSKEAFVAVSYPMAQNSHEYRPLVMFALVEGNFHFQDTGLYDSIWIQFGPPSQFGQYLYQWLALDILCRKTRMMAEVCQLSASEIEGMAMTHAEDKLISLLR